MTYAGSEDSTFDQRRFGPKTMAILPLFILVNSEYWAKSRRKAIKYLEKNRRDEREDEVGEEGKGEDEWEWGREWREVMRKGGKTRGEEVGKEGKRERGNRR